MSYKGQKYTKRNHFNESDLKKYYTTYGTTYKGSVTSEEWIESLRAALTYKGRFGIANFYKRIY